MPAFITGLTNSMGSEFKANLRGAPRVVAIFGDPVEIPTYEGETRVSHHKKLADVFNERILALAEQEKAVRTSVASPPPQLSR